MKVYIQSVLNIVIIGNFFSSVNCNRQFPPIPPFPYYHDDQYYVPGFVPPYPEPVPVFYSSDNIRPPPLPYETYNIHSTQLFQQNKNYNPPETLKPGQTYKIPPIAPPQFSNSPIYPQVSKYKIFIGTLPIQEPQKTNQQNPINSQNTNVITKDEPFYLDNFNKNYPDEDYSDNYSDEVTPQPEPCSINSPYRYFQPDPNNPNIKIPLCNPYIQPQFINAVYGLKTPITILPSRFPPMIEQFIERIQNYFSTYTERETQRPQQQTQPTSTAAPPVVTSESEPVVPSIETENNNKNTTEETQPPVEVSPEIEVTSVALDKVTENAEIVTTQSETVLGKDILPTLQPDVPNQNESQMDLLSHSEVITETTPSVMEPSASTVAEELSKNETSMEMTVSAVTEQKNETAQDEHSVNEVENCDEKTSTVLEDATIENSVTEASTQAAVEDMKTTSEITSAENKSEDYNSISTTTNEIFHQTSVNTS